MLGIGFFEIIIIALVSLIALGPKQLPLVMRQLAFFYRRLLSIKQEVNNILEDPDLLVKDDTSLKSSDRDKNL